MKKRPNIQTPYNDKLRIKNLITEVISDAWIYTYSPDTATADENDLITLVLTNKKFVFEDVKVDIISDYIDIFIFGIKITEDTYNVTVSDNNINIEFTQILNLVDVDDIVTTDFLIKGKIVEI